MAEEKTERVLQDIMSLHAPNAESTVTLSGHEGDGFTGSSAAAGRVVPSSGSTAPVASSSSIVSEGDGAKVEKLPGMPFPAPVFTPTQEGPHGLRYDFNLGIRLQMPVGEQWRLCLWDGDTESRLYEGKGKAKGEEGAGQFICSSKKFFLHGVIELFNGDELVWSHEYDARGKKVAIIIPAGTLGDPLAWLPYAARFGMEHECELTIVVSEMIIDLVSSRYPEIRFLQEKDFSRVRGEFYATYYLGLFFVDENQEWQPRDFRMVGLHRTAGWILGVDPAEAPSHVEIAQPDARPVEDPYVVVAVQASCACKMWHNPSGWLETVSYLKKMGYRVICIDKEPVVGDGIYWNPLPHGVEDETGARPLAERARWLKHAEFFVGLSSGLAWLAWAVGTPVVMISGFTNPSNEFYTPYRVFSTHGCNSCWHDVRTPFQHDDYLFCPRHKGTERAFECTRIINAGYVIATIRRLCRDYGFQSPIRRRGAVCSESVEDVRNVKEKQKNNGVEARNLAYWDL